MGAPAPTSPRAGRRVPRAERGSAGWHAGLVPLWPCYPDSGGTRVEARWEKDVGASKFMDLGPAPNLHFSPKLPETQVPAHHTALTTAPGHVNARGMGKRWLGFCRPSFQRLPNVLPPTVTPGNRPCVSKGGVYHKLQ